MPVNTPGSTAPRSATAPPSVAVSNPTRQHSHQTAYAFQQAGMLDFFATSLWNAPNCWLVRLKPFLPAFLGRFVSKLLEKRQLDGLDTRQVVQFQLAEMVRLALLPLLSLTWQARVIYVVRRIHDWHFSRILEKTKPEVVIGYEMSSQRCFQKARDYGAMTILDLAGLPHDFVVREREKFGLHNDKWLNSQIRKAKLAELDLADHVLCLSSLARNELVASGYAAEKISVIPLGVDFSRFIPRPQRVAGAPLTFMYVGAVSRTKGVEVLLQAFVQAAIPNARLWLVGSVPDPGFLAPYRGAYEHFGFLSHNELAEKYREADVCVLPSYFDSWGQVVTEAMASGLPVIVTDHCGARDLVDESTGWVVESGDVQSLAHTLGLVSQSREQLDGMGAVANQRVAALSWECYRNAVVDAVSGVFCNWKAKR